MTKSSKLYWQEFIAWKFLWPSVFKLQITAHRNCIYLIGMVKLTRIYLIRRCLRFARTICGSCYCLENYLHRWDIPYFSISFQCCQADALSSFWLAINSNNRISILVQLILLLKININKIVLRLHFFCLEYFCCHPMEPNEYNYCFISVFSFGDLLFLSVFRKIKGEWQNPLGIEVNWWNPLRDSDMEHRIHNLLFGTPGKTEGVRVSLDLMTLSICHTEE